MHDNSRLTTNGKMNIYLYMSLIKNNVKEIITK